MNTILAGVLGLSLLAAGAAWAAEGPATRPAATRPATTQPAGTPLKLLAEKRGMLFGVAAVGRLLADPDSPYAKTVARECSVITPENDMKFGPLRPTPEKWNWANADSLVDFAGKHGIKVHGHTLVWHEQVPKWVTETKRTPQEARDLMLAHIEAVVGRFRGKVYAWDVVNEAIEKDGTLRKTYWKDNVGDDYIDLAFRKAHEVDPKAKLVYNDYAMEGGGKKADAVFDLVKGMKQRGVPIDAVGFQCHWEVGKYPAIEDIRADIKRFHDLGLEVWITELDLRVKVPATAEDLARQADAYASLVKMFVETGAVRSIQTWGLDDGHSWIPHSSPGFGDALLLDRDFRPKPAYFAVAKILGGGLGASSPTPFDKDIDNLVAGTPEARIKSSLETLRSAGVKAFASLIQHFGDSRLAENWVFAREMVEITPDGRMKGHEATIAEVCFDILQGQIEGNWPKGYRTYYILTPGTAQLWLDMHPGMTLKQLRIAAAEESLAKVRRDLATQPSTAGGGGEFLQERAVPFLQKRLEEVRK